MNVSDKMHEELMYAANFYGNSRGVVAYCNRRTEDALLRRGLITYDTNQSDHFPIITVAGWAYLTSTGFQRRAEDFGRLTLEEALEEAWPASAAAVIETDDMLDVAVRLLAAKQLEEQKSGRWYVVPVPYTASTRTWNQIRREDTP